MNHISPIFHHNIGAARMLKVFCGHLGSMIADAINVFIHSHSIRERGWARKVARMLFASNAEIPLFSQRIGNNLAFSFSQGYGPLAGMEMLSFQNHDESQQILRSGLYSAEEISAALAWQAHVWLRNITYAVHAKVTPVVESEALTLGKIRIIAQAFESVIPEENPEAEKITFWQPVVTLLIPHNTFKECSNRKVRRLMQILALMFEHSEHDPELELVFYDDLQHRHRDVSEGVLQMLKQETRVPYADFLHGAFYAGIDISLDNSEN